MSLCLHSNHCVIDILYSYYITVVCVAIALLLLEFIKQEAALQ